jgi:DNA-binding MarR family transcriptional regulator
MHEDICLSDYSALATFHGLLQRLVDATEHRARQAGLQRLKFLLMIAIRRQAANGATTLGALAESLELDRNTVTELVDELVRQRFVVREKDRADRRRFLIALTPAGDAWLAPLVEEDLRELSASGPDLMRSLKVVLAHAAASAARPRSQARADMGEFAWRGVGTAPV